MVWKLVLAVIAIATILYFAGKVSVYLQFKEEIARLFSKHDLTSRKEFKYADLTDLPQPVQHYFRHVLKEGQPYIASARLLHDGQFKTDLKKDWVNMSGEEYFTTGKPGFVWKGTTLLFTARDMYIANQGRLVVSLFNLIKVLDGKGPKYDEGELLRWLGESACFPTNLLPSENLEWLPVDDDSAKLNFRHEGIFISFVVTFDNNHEIIQMETERYMDDVRKEKWINKTSDHEVHNDVLIPTLLEAGWQLKEGYFPYAKFKIRKIEYDKSEMF
ncbi:DUF6544 family protein [Dyadobacter arcticus]|uniref:Uncharacterized protein n=1 Tax=Dyadobacter arcticus TaxID=1078754 RepID=A0ABX0ULL4_9BACT|nr:DUF6544 family protein [Dyadobacter arcticus]NIJ52570.1 hypothetical protein [Dyadobacter arcticus]